MASVRAAFTTTVDAASGAAAKHGSRPTEVMLAPGGEQARVANIQGWELDSALRLRIDFRTTKDSEPLRVSYDLGGPRHRRDLVALGEVYEVPPFILQSPG